MIHHARSLSFLAAAIPYYYTPGDPTSVAEVANCVPIPVMGDPDNLTAVDPRTGHTLRVDFLKYWTCTSMCACTLSAGCTVKTEEVNTFAFDGVLEAGGNKLVGTMVAGTERVTVRLDRR